MAFKMEDLKIRFLISLIMIVVLGALLTFSNQSSFALVLVGVFVAGISLALWELYHMAHLKGFKFNPTIGFVTTAAYIITSYLATKDAQWSNVPLIILGAALFALFIEQLIKNDNPFINIALHYLGLVYVVVPLVFLLKIIFIAPDAIIDGRWWAMFLILVTKAGDVGAYFTGKMIGKHSLAPKISPKKTVEGLIGGIVFSIGISFALIYFSKPVLPHFNCPWLYAIILGSSLAIMGLLGDLAESLIKRDSNVKDSNKLKGFGGMLDLVDSLIFTAPAFFLFLLYGNWI